MRKSCSIITQTIMSSETILVTGATGQLGRHVALSAGSSQDSWIFVSSSELDITDSQAVERFFDSHRISAVVNCAAYTNVEGAEDDMPAARRVNALAPGYLGRACARHDAVLIHISTDYVFDGKGCRPYVEDDPTAPLCAYGLSKAEGEQAVVASGCRHIVIRTSWLYSLFGNNFVKTMLRLTGERDTLGVVFDQVGTPTYAGDLADAIVHMIERRMHRNLSGLFHYSDEGVCSWFDFAHRIAALAGHTGCRITPCRSSQYPTKAARPCFSVLDKSKFKESVGLTIPHWSDSLEKMLKEGCSF